MRNYGGFLSECVESQWSQSTLALAQTSAIRPATVRHKPLGAGTRTIIERPPSYSTPRLSHLDVDLTSNSALKLLGDTIFSGSGLSYMLFFVSNSSIS